MRLIGEVVGDGDIVEDEVVEVQVAIVELVLVGIDALIPWKKLNKAWKQEQLWNKQTMKNSMEREREREREREIILESPRMTTFYTLH